MQPNLVSSRNVPSSELTSSSLVRHGQNRRDIIESACHFRTELNMWSPRKWSLRTHIEFIPQHSNSARKNKNASLLSITSSKEMIELNCAPFKINAQRFSDKYTYFEIEKLPTSRNPITTASRPTSLETLLFTIRATEVAMLSTHSEPSTCQFAPHRSSCAWDRFFPQVEKKKCYLFFFL